MEFVDGKTADILRNSTEMIKLDPIIAVKNVEASAEWYHKIFGYKNAHGGNHFAILTTDDNEIILCLHAWETDSHTTMTDQNTVAGNGLLFYFRTESGKK